MGTRGRAMQKALGVGGCGPFDSFHVALPTVTLVQSALSAVRKYLASMHYKANKTNLQYTYWSRHNASLWLSPVCY